MGYVPNGKITQAKKDKVAGGTVPDPREPLGLGFGKLGIGEYGQVRGINSEAVGKAPGKSLLIRGIDGIVKNQIGGVKQG